MGLAQESHTRTTYSSIPPTPTKVHSPGDVGTQEDFSFLLSTCSSFPAWSLRPTLTSALSLVSAGGQQNTNLENAMNAVVKKRASALLGPTLFQQTASELQPVWEDKFSFSFRVQSA